MSAAERARAAAPAADGEITEEQAAASAAMRDDVPSSALIGAEKRQKARARRTRDFLMSQPKVRIRLSKDDVRGEDQIVGINGFFMTIKRGHSVEVPQGIAEVLERAGLI